LIAILGDNVARAKYFQFSIDFVGLGVKDEMLLQGKFKSFSHGASVLA